MTLPANLGPRNSGSLFRNENTVVAAIESKNQSCHQNWLYDRIDTAIGPKKLRSKECFCQTLAPNGPQNYSQKLVSARLWPRVEHSFSKTEYVLKPLFGVRHPHRSELDSRESKSRFWTLNPALGSRVFQTPKRALSSHQPCFRHTNSL